MLCVDPEHLADAIVGTTVDVEIASFRNGLYNIRFAKKKNLAYTI